MAAPKAAEFFNFLYLESAVERINTQQCLIIGYLARDNNHLTGAITQFENK